MNFKSKSKLSKNNAKVRVVLLKVAFNAVVIGALNTFILGPSVALESIATMPVDLNVNARFSMAIDSFAVSAPAAAGSSESSSSFGFSPSSGVINFGTYDFQGNLPSQSVEIYCSSNTGNNWQIDITGEPLVNSDTGTVLNGSPLFWSWAPVPANAGDFQQALGTCYNGSFPTSAILYRSAPAETGSGILIILGLNANIQGIPEAGNYSTQITLTMHE